MKSHATAADKIRPSQVMKDGGLWLRVGGGGSWLVPGTKHRLQMTWHAVIKANENPVTFTYSVAL